MLTQKSQSLDVRGLSCPMPVIKTKTTLEKLASGEVLEVISSDRGALRDVPAWVQMAGHELLEAMEEDGAYRFLIRKR